MSILITSMNKTRIHFAFIVKIYISEILHNKNKYPHRYTI